MKRNLFLASLLACSLGAAASDWEAPQLSQPLEPTDGEMVYILNVASGQFLTGGNGWNTQASISNEGLQFLLVKETASDGSECWTMKNQRPNKLNQYFFSEGWDRAFIDMGTQDQSYPDCNHWLFDRQADGTYTIQLVPTCSLYDEGCYMAWVSEGSNKENGGSTSTAVYPVVSISESDPEVNGFYWQFATEADYQAYRTRRPLYDKMVEADRIGLEVPEDVVAIYNNPDATAEQLNEAKETVAALIFKYEMEQLGGVDVTDTYLVNPNFDQNQDGWVGCQGESWWTENAFHIKPGETFVNEKTGASLNRFVCQFRWSGDWLAYLNNSETYQTVTLPAGKYRLEADGVAIQQGEGAGQFGTPTHTPATGFYLFAATSLGENRTQIITERKGDEIVPERIPERFYVEFLTAGGQVNLGVKLVDTKASWTGADNFKLICQTLISSPHVVELAVLQTDLQKYVDAYDDAPFSAAVLSAMEKLIDDCDDPIENEDVDACVALYEQGKALVEQMNAEIAAYSRLNEVYETAAAALENGTYELLGEELQAFLSDYCDEVLGHLGDADVTAEVAMAVVEKYYTELARFAGEYVAATDEGLDVSGLMRNANMYQGDDWNNGNGSAIMPGWEGTRPWSHGSRGTIEYYNQSFDIYQQLHQVPAGVYTVELLGFYRWGDTEETLASFGTPVEGANNTGYVYLNDVRMPLHLWSDGMRPIPEGENVGSYGNGQTNTNLFDEEGRDLWVPSTLWYFMDHYRDSLYLNHNTIVLPEGGDLRIGIAANQEHAKNYSLLKGVRLRYEGTSPRAMKAAFDPIIGELQRKIEKAYNTMPMSRELYELPQTLQAEADALAASGTMADCAAYLQQLTAKMQEIDALLSVANDLQNSWTYYDRNIYQDESSAEFRAQFDALPEILKGKSLAWETNEQMRRADYDFNALFVAGVRAKAEGATADKPYDMSVVIRTPEFYDFSENETSARYWQGVGEGSKVECEELEFWNVASFDLHQTIPALPQGYYRLSVQGFYRQGADAQTHANHVADGTENLASFLYATAGEESWQTPLMSILAGATSDMNVLMTGESYTEDVDGGFVPSSMQAAQDFFQYDPEKTGLLNTGFYTGNTIDLHIGAATADLRIGIRKDADYPGDWTVVDHFQLLYLGQQAPDAIDATLAGNGTVAQRLYHNMSGIRLARPQHGLNIVTDVMTDGSRQSRVVMVK